MKEKKEIGKLIADKRKELKLTQQELASYLNVSDKAISNWETGKNYPDYVYLSDISKILGIDLTENIIKKDNKAKKILLNILQFIIFLSFILTFVYFILNYNQYQKYNILSANQTINLNESYIYITKNETIFYLDEISNSKDFIMKDLIITIYNEKNERIYKKKNNNPTTVIEANDKNSIFNKNTLNNLYLEIEYKKSNNEEENIKIPLKIKTMAQKKSVSKDTLILLKNNDYQKETDNKYLKEYKEYKFIYYLQNKKIIYHKNTDNEKIHAEMIIKGQNQYLKYEISKNNELTEKYDYEKINENNDNLWEIHSILYNEYIKLADK